MFDRKFLDDLTKKINECIPASVKHAKKDIEQNVKEILQTTFAKLNLVTREEFDTQMGVLQKTRKKLEALEKELAALEKSIEKKTGKAK